jgi:hypothetical protein
VRQKPCNWCDGLVAADEGMIAHSIPECAEYKKLVASLGAELGTPKVDIIAIDEGGEKTKLTAEELRGAEEARASGKSYTVERHAAEVEHVQCPACGRVDARAGRAHGCATCIAFCGSGARRWDVPGHRNGKPEKRS